MIPYNTEQQQLIHQEILSLLQKGAIEPPLIRNSQEERRASTCLQPEETQLIYHHTTLQNGDSAGSNPHHQSQQLDDINRFIGCLSPHPGTSIITTIPSLPLGPYIVSVQNNTLWTILSALVVYQNNQAYSRMGPATEHPSQLLSRRLDFDR
ncbi:hypothetical protein G6F60_012160 [Rhizopus arrhizus]|nr:hypothetical protein G6F60_012160 [Rhizopus arrhizus]